MGETSDSSISLDMISKGPTKVITLSGLHFINVKAINLEYGALELISNLIESRCGVCGWGGVVH